MDFIKFLLDALGWRWCISKPQTEAQKLLGDFLTRKIPIFWVMGPAYCGKTATSEKIVELTEYNLIKVSQLLQTELEKGGYEATVIEEYINACGAAPNEIVIPLIRQEIIKSYEHARGFIIDGFPLDIGQAKSFVENICKPSIIIFVCLLEENLLARIRDIEGIDLKEAIKNHTKNMKKLNEIYRRYEMKTLKLVTNTPTDKLTINLLHYLNDHYGYSF